MEKPEVGIDWRILFNRPYGSRMQDVGCWMELVSIKSDDRLLLTR
jgi:hypothetical protein